MNLRTWWGLKYLLLLLPRHKSHINVLLLLPRRTSQINVTKCKLNNTHSSECGVGVLKPATSATTKYMSHKRNKM